MAQCRQHGTGVLIEDEAGNHDEERRKAAEAAVGDAPAPQPHRPGMRLEDIGKAIDSNDAPAPSTAS